MKELRDAIRAVLDSAIVSSGGYNVSRDTLLILQAEYNIHFIEPEDKQYEGIYD